MVQSPRDERDRREHTRRLTAYEEHRRQHAVEQRRRRRIRLFSVGLIAVVLVAGVVLISVVVGRDADETTDSTQQEESSPAQTPEPTADTTSAPPASLSENRDWSGALTLNDDVELGFQLDGGSAPQGVASFVELSRTGFYDGTNCHRLTTGGSFVLQCGSPDGTPTGSPGYSYGPIENAPTDNVYTAGTIAMARIQNDAESMGSQFFIVYEDTTIPPDNAGGYTVLGRITDGLDALIDNVVDGGVSGGGNDGPPARDARITSITVE